MSGSNGILKTAVDNLRDAVNWATRAIAMTDDQKLQYDNRDNISSAVKAMDLYVGNGDAPELAYQKTMANLTRTLFPDAQFLDSYKKKYEFARAQALNSGYGGSETKALKQAKELYENAAEQKKIYELISSELQKHVNSLNQENQEREQAKKKAEEEAKLAKIKAAAEEEKERPKGSMAYLDNQISGKKKELSLAVNDTDRIRISRELDELVQKRRYMDLDIKYTNKSIIDTRQSKDMAKIMEDFRKMKDLPKGWNKIAPIPDKSVKNVDDMTTGLENMSTILGSLGGLMSQSSDNMGAWALSSAANIAQMIVQLQALATAQGVASAFSAPWPASLAAVATVLTTVASIFSSLPQFAEGGIIGGSSYFGDRLLARVNSGEMILNQKQQRRLYDLTTSGGGATVSLGVSRIQGSDLYLALSNYMKKTGKKL